ncbi:MAG: serine/threonine protein kinase [Deltaproteobacteria bacterium]|nr:serine/threonine protein kinase [Deltaproteobacteria bacterium]
MPALGHFELVETIGEDATGVVHRATDTRSGTAAFVRVLKGAVPARRDRFLRETKRAARLDRDGFARVLDFGQTPEGDAFVAVEDPKGERLSARLASGEPLDAIEAVAIAMQLVRSLAAAHDAGVVHRELRPSVVVVEGAGEEVRVTITDLALGWSPIAGDPEMVYVAPEHRRPGETVGRRADVFSIGAMLHTMLTGKPPSSGAIEGGVMDGPIGGVVRRCLAEDPRDRYLDTLALDAALRGAIAPRLSSIPPPKRESKAPGEARPTPTPPPVSASASASASASPSASASTPPPPSLRVTPSTPPPSVRPASAARAPAAPPPRPLGRPLTARPAWEDSLLDFADGPVPRVAIAAVVAFVLVRILTSGIVPFLVAAAAGALAYATWRRSRGPTSP